MKNITDVRNMTANELRKLQNVKAKINVNPNCPGKFSFTCGKTLTLREYVEVGNLCKKFYLSLENGE